MDFHTAQQGILAGIRVVELANVLAGPSVGMFLAEAGAEVLKIEPPQGDVTRTWRVAGEAAEGPSAYYAAANWGKTSLRLDLRQPEARASALAYTDQADIVLTSYLPGAAARLGMEAEALMARNPRLICAEINGYGPDAPRPAYDAILQAEAGFTAMNGTSTADIHKMPVALVDILAAHHLKEAILLALLHRHRTGQGMRLSVSLFDAAVASLANQATNWLQAQHLPQPMGSEHPNIVPYGTLFGTAEGGHIVLAVGTDAQFAALCHTLSLPELARAYPRNADRVQHRAAVNAALAGAIAAQPREPLLASLQARQVPAGAVNDLPAVFKLPAAQALVLRQGGLRGLRTLVAQGPQFPQLPLAPPG